MNREYHALRKVLTTHVTPAILPISYKELEDRLNKIASVVDWVQIDIVDGIYAPNKTWPYVGDTENMFPLIVKQDEPMPCWDTVNFEIDLMISNPLQQIDAWIATGAMRFVIHIDSVDMDTCIKIAEKIEEKGVEMVLGFSVHSSLDKLQEYISALESSERVYHSHRNRKVVNWVQCMGIERIGFQGEPFAEKTIDNIKHIKEKLPYILVSVDGAVNPDTAPRLIQAGADRVVVGSALFKSESIEETLVRISNMFSEKKIPVSN